jgi:hypothetical protein
MMYARTVNDFILLHEVGAYEVQGVGYRDKL